MRLLLIEDEAPAMTHLARSVRAWDPRVEIVGECGGVEEAITYLKRHSPPDLIISDIQLSDGLALEIFESIGVPCPVVFTTAWDSYVMDALRVGGIDYLLKPITPERLGEALDKYLSLKAHFSLDMSALERAVTGGRAEPRRRIIVRRGEGFFALNIEEVRWFTSEHGLVFAVDANRKRHLLDGTLSQLAEELDGGAFFRANRRYVVAARGVVGYRPYFKGRLILTLAPSAEEDVIVSAQNTRAFKSWMDR